MKPTHSHISQRYNQEMEDLRSRLLAMGGLVQAQLERALLSLRMEDKVEFAELATRLAYPSPDAARKAFHAAEARLLAGQAQEGGGHGDEFGICFGRVDSQHIHIPLEKLARATALGPLVAPKGAKRPPAEGEGQFALFLGNHARQGGG